MLRLLWIVIVCSLPAILSSCGPPVPASSSNSASPKAVKVPDINDLDGVAILDVIERRVAESIARLRESVVALEYAAAEAPSGGGTGTRRVATGVVVGERGEVLSIRIDAPPASSTIVARDVSGGRHPAQWVAADADTGLTLLRIDPGIARAVRPTSRGPRLGSQVLVVGNPF